MKISYFIMPNASLVARKKKAHNLNDLFMKKYESIRKIESRAFEISKK